MVCTHHCVVRVKSLNNGHSSKKNNQQEGDYLTAFFSNMVLFIFQDAAKLHLISKKSTSVYKLSYDCFSRAQMCQ